MINNTLYAGVVSLTLVSGVRLQGANAEDHAVQPTEHYYISFYTKFKDKS